MFSSRSCLVKDETLRYIMTKIRSFSDDQVFAPGDPCGKGSAVPVAHYTCIEKSSPGRKHEVRSASVIRICCITPAKT